MTDQNMPPVEPELNTPDTFPEGLPPTMDESIASDQPIAAEALPVYTLNDYRLDALTRAIERYPYNPINYVLRGELYLSLRQGTAAAADFNQAITLASTTGESELLTWGYLNAALIDRAHDGLRAVSHLPATPVEAAQESSPPPQFDGMDTVSAQESLSQPGVETPGYGNKVPLGLDGE